MSDGRYRGCCHKGKIKLERRQSVLQLLRDLVKKAVCRVVTIFMKNSSDIKLVFLSFQFVLKILGYYIP